MCGDGRGTMPHRHLVRWADEARHVDCEVEALQDGVVLDSADPKVSDGGAAPGRAVEEAEAWLCERFRKVEIDASPKPNF